MIKQTSFQVARRFAAFTICLALFLGIVCGCGLKKPKLSKAAQAFKQEVKGGWERLAPSLSGPVAQADKAATQAVLKDIFTKAEQAGRPVTFRVAVLDRNGIMLTSYPVEGGGVEKRFADYQVVQEAMNKGKITQGTLYLHGGDKIYVVCFPLISQDKLVGLLAAAFSSKEVEEKWKVTEKEFLQIDFNS